MTQSILAISIDTDDWYNMPGVSGCPFSIYRTTNDFFSRWKDRYDYLSEPTNKVLSFLKELNIKATFFVIAHQVYWYPKLVETIALYGHEIACHGLFHDCKIHPETKAPLMTPTEFEERTGKAKQLLEQTSGQKVIGYRAPDAFIAGWMIDSLEKLGFQYDSSVVLSSIHNKTPEKLGDLKSKPYYPKYGSLQKGGKRQIIEIPMPCWDIFGLRLPTSGGPFLRFFGASYIHHGLKQSLQYGDSVFYFHSIDISDENFPNITSKKRQFYWLIKGNTVVKRIEKILTIYKPYLGTCQDILIKYNKANEVTE